MADGELLVIYADAGQGDCTLIFFPEGQVWMIDCGCKANRDVNGAVSEQIPRVIERGFKRRFGDKWEDKRVDKGEGKKWLFDHLIITHPDSDHYNLIETVLCVATFDTVLFGGDLQDYGLSKLEQLLQEQGELLKELSRILKMPYRLRHHFESIHSIWEEYIMLQSELENLTEDELPPIRDFFREKEEESKIVNENIFWSSTEYGGVTFTPLAINFRKNLSNSESLRPYRKGTVSNGNSVVFMIEYKEYKFFFMGDATALVEYSIHSNPQVRHSNEKATILKLSHHGSHTSSIQEWIWAVQPDIVVISSDCRSYGGVSLPRKALIDLVRNCSPNIIDNPRCILREHTYYCWDQDMKGSIFDEFVVEKTELPICTTLYSVEPHEKGYAGGAWWFSVDDQGNLNHQLEDDADQDDDNPPIMVPVTILDPMQIDQSHHQVSMDVDERKEGD